MAALEGVVYVLETSYSGGVGSLQSGLIRTYEARDPKVLTEVLPQEPIAAAPRDIGGDGTTLVVTTMPRVLFGNDRIVSGPGTLLVYNASGKTPRLTGATTLWA